MHEFSHQHVPSTLHTSEVLLTTEGNSCHVDVILSKRVQVKRKINDAQVPLGGHETTNVSILTSVDMCALQIVLQQEDLHITFIICAYGCRFWACA